MFSGLTNSICIRSNIKLIILVLSILFSREGVGQIKQSVQVKTFDQQLKPYKNIELLLNEKIKVQTGEKGAAYIEINEADISIRSIEIKNEGLEPASWNFSKGVVEIIVRKKNFQLASVMVMDSKQQPIEKTEVTFAGKRKIVVRTNANGKIDIPLALDEKIISPNQFAINGYQPTKLASLNGAYTLIIEPLRRPVEEVKPSPAIVTSKRFYEKEISSLDSAQSLSSFYQIIRGMPMSDLSVEQKAKIDAMFNQLLLSMQQSATSKQPLRPISVSDSSRNSDDIKQLIEKATEDGKKLEAQRAEFDVRIEALNSKLSTGIVNQDPDSRNRLLKDIVALEKLLRENENKFVKNQNDYKQILETLKESHFSINVLEGKLSESESLRLQQEKEFRERIVFALILFIIFLILIIQLVRVRAKLKKQKKELTIANNEVKQINENLEGIVARRTNLLQEVNTELDTFLYKASHDLRSPVASIIGVCNLSDHITQRELVEKVVSATEKMDSLLKRLSAISEINHPTGLGEVKLGEVLEKVRRKYEKLILNGRIEATFICSDSIQLKTYPRLLESVLTNLLENAVFFASLNEGSERWVRVIVTNTHDKITIVVEDNGIGFESNVKSRIFDMFFIGTEKSKGSGLGLYMVGRSLRPMNGTIEVDSQVNSLTRFTVQLPLQLTN